MGTNYYWYPSDSSCTACGRSDEPLHIGKASIGWVFALHVIPEKNLGNLEDWRNLWEGDPEGEIKDEYHRSVAPHGMLQIITNRSFSAGLGPRSDPFFLTSNRAAAGPHGLLRSRLGEPRISHGEGTWDLHQGEFS